MFFFYWYGDHLVHTALTHPSPTRRPSVLVGALEAEDRLLEGADRENGTADAARAFAGKEFLRQRGHDVPLIGIGVLCLVDQDVIESPVELEQDRKSTRLNSSH